MEGLVSVTAYDPGPIKILVPDSDPGNSYGKGLLPFTCIIKSFAVNKERRSLVVDSDSLMGGLLTFLITINVAVLSGYCNDDPLTRFVVEPWTAWIYIIDMIPIAGVMVNDSIIDDNLLLKLINYFHNSNIVNDKGF